MAQHRSDVSNKYSVASGLYTSYIFHTLEMQVLEHGNSSLKIMLEPSTENFSKK